MTDLKIDCSQIDLSTALSTDEISDRPEFVTHLETCLACRMKLETLAASDDWWQDCRSNLGQPQDPDECEPDLYQSLGPPSHPEMLGRIGRYEVEKLLGHGGMGVVFKAFDSELNRPVAIKVLAPHLAGSGAARKRFGREARAAAAIVHEHVVAIHDVDVAASSPYLVMQYVPGESLQSYVDREGPLDPSDLARIGHQIASGLAAAHSQGVVHRDIKPGNIMLENGLSRVVITDFGLARAADDASLTQSGIVAGTPHYMSPEQARGEPSDARSDLYSLGAVLYFMAIGHPPFRAEQAMAVLHRICHDRPRSVDELNSAIPWNAVTMIARLLEKKPARRFHDANQVKESLSHVLSEMQRPQRPSLKLVWSSLHRYRQPLFVSAALLVAFVAYLAALVDPSQFDSNQSPTNGPIPVHSATSHAGTAPLGPKVIAEPDFATEMASLNQTVNYIVQRKYPESEAIDKRPDPWTLELRAILDAARQLESQEPLTFGPSPSFNSQVGESR